MQFAWYDLIGSIGVATIILTYILLQTEKIKSERLAYSVLNALGAGMIVFSLIYSFNFSAFILEALWVLISLYGIWKYFSGKK
jgi:paired small multidrug resistance pump